MKIDIIHTPEFAQWVFSENHPTQGRRFINGLDRIQALGDVTVHAPKPHGLDPLLSVHDETYVREVTELGESLEWMGQRTDLGNLAVTFNDATLTALELLLNGQSTLAINLTGAKHHARYSQSSGFCVFNDFAVAADVVTKLGKRVVILDTDAHHGDGTQELTYTRSEVLTFSIHERGIFPYPYRSVSDYDVWYPEGEEDDPSLHVYNYPLWPNTDGVGLQQGVDRFLHVAGQFQPDIVFVAAGADGHAQDPLSSLAYSTDDYRIVGQRVRDAFGSDMPILMGGAGGYRPDDWTPEMWAAMADGLRGT